MMRDWDYVTTNDHARDMAESASRAAEIISAMKGQKREAERALIAAVLAAGGRIVVSPRDLIDADRGLLRIERRGSDDCLILTATR